MKILFCKIAGFRSETLPNKVSITDGFLGIIWPFERHLFLSAVAKIQVFILPSVFHQANVRNEKVELAEKVLHVSSKVRLPQLQQKVLKLLKCKCLLLSLVRICICLDKRSHYCYLLFQKNKF